MIRTVFILLFIFCSTHVSTTYASVDTDTKLRAEWAEVKVALAGGEYGKAGDKIGVLRKDLYAAGYETAPHFGEELLKYAYEAYSEGARERAIFLLHHAEDLSADSPQFFLNSLPLARDLGVRTALEQMVEFVVVTLHDPRYLLHLVVVIVYPLLWSLTFAVVLCAVTQLIQSRGKYMHRSQEFGKEYFIIVALILLGLLFGPFVSLIVCSALISYRLRVRWVALCGAVVCCAWVIGAPLRERLAAALEDTQLQYDLTELLSEYSPVQPSTEKEGGRTTPALLSQIAQARRAFRDGNFAEASSAFLELEKERGFGALFTAWRGLCAVADEDYAEAQRLFSRAQAGGFARNADLLYSLSKVRFALSDTAGSEVLLRKALEYDSPRTKLLEEHSGTYLAGDYHGYPRFKVSASIVAGALLEVEKNRDKNEQGWARASRRLSELTCGLGMPLLLGGIALLALIGVRGRATEEPTPQQGMGVVDQILWWIPGAPLVSFNRPAAGVVLLSLLLFLLFPIIGWPDRFIGDFSSFVGIYYSGFVVLLWLITVYVSRYISVRYELKQNDKKEGE